MNNYIKNSSDYTKTNLLDLYALKDCQKCNGNGDVRLPVPCECVIISSEYDMLVESDKSRIKNTSSNKFSKSSDYVKLTLPDLFHQTGKVYALRNCKMCEGAGRRPLAGLNCPCTITEQYHSQLLELEKRQKEENIQTMYAKTLNALITTQREGKWEDYTMYKNTDLFVNTKCICCKGSGKIYLLDEDIMKICYCIKNSENFYDMKHNQIVEMLNQWR